MITYQSLVHIEPNNVASMDGLLEQISSSAHKLEVNKVNKALIDGDLVLFVALVNKEVVGMLCLVFFTIPTGVRARIEDVVVDHQYRRQGIGRHLTRLAVEHYRSSGAKTLDLTSNPQRAEANNLYQSEGFKLRKTNVYRLAND